MFAAVDDRTIAISCDVSSVTPLTLISGGCSIMKHGHLLLQASYDLLARVQLLLKLLDSAHEKHIHFAIVVLRDEERASTQVTVGESPHALVIDVIETLPSRSFR